MEEKEKNKFELTKEWRRLVKVAAQIGYGTMEIDFSGGKPVMIREVTRSIKLDGPEDETGKNKSIKL